MKCVRPGNVIQLVKCASIQRILVCWVCFTLKAVCPLQLEAAPIPIPNASFESPPTVFVETRIDAWQETAKPASYDENDGYTWDQLTGVFLNTPSPSADHIDNCHGNQAMYLFAVPEVGIFQDYDSVDWLDMAPTHEFNAIFEAGKSYNLTVGVIGGGGGMLNGASLELSFYYRDASSNKVTVAATNIVHSTTLFSNTTHFVDCSLDLLPVRPTDPWAGKYIGVKILSTVPAAQAGGYWDVDNVRLTSIREATLTNPVLTNNQFRFTLESEPGLRFEILANTNFTTTNWISRGIVTNSSGSLYVTNTLAESLNQSFYRPRRLP